MQLREQRDPIGGRKYAESGSSSAATYEAMALFSLLGLSGAINQITLLWLFSAALIGPAAIVVGVMRSVPIKCKYAPPHGDRLALEEQLQCELYQPGVIPRRGN
jgi:hypothetical protein